MNIGKADGDLQCLINLNKQDNVTALPNILESVSSMNHELLYETETYSSPILTMMQLASKQLAPGCSNLGFNICMRSNFRDLTPYSLQKLWELFLCYIITNRHYVQKKVQDLCCFFSFLTSPLLILKPVHEPVPFLKSCLSPHHTLTSVIICLFLINVL